MMKMVIFIFSDGEKATSRQLPRYGQNACSNRSFVI